MPHQGSGNSSSVHKRSSMSSSSTKALVTASGLASGSTDEDKEEAKAIYKMARLKNGNPNKLILAVVKHNQKKPLRALVAKDKKSNSPFVIITPRELQDMLTPNGLQEMLKPALIKGLKALCMLVSSTVGTITYDIPKDFKDVEVIPCGRQMSGQGALRIGSLSKYCGERTYAWERLRKPRRQITHGIGCYWDIGDDLVKAQELIGGPNMASEPTDAEISAIRNEALKFQNMFINQPSQSGSEQTWLSKWITLLATALGAGGGIRAFGGSFWYSSAGIYIGGPRGFSIAARCMSFAGGFGGAAGAVGAGAIIAAGAAVFFIHKDTIFQYLHEKLRAVWESIKEIFAWAWQKIKELGSAVMSAIEDPFQGVGQRPARFSA